jgi:hypothetical protein
MKKSQVLYRGPTEFAGLTQNPVKNKRKTNKNFTKKRKFNILKVKRRQNVKQFVF